MTQARGEVFDIGYQRYRGAREGRVRAIKTLWTNGVRTSLGIGRGLFAKIIPGLAFLVLMVPALLFPVLNAMFGDGGFGDAIPGQDDYYADWLAFVFILFTAIVGPELLVADRRCRSRSSTTGGRKSETSPPLRTISLISVDDTNEN